MSSDGRVSIRQIAMNDPVNRSSNLTLHPRQDLEELRRYLSAVAVEARKEIENLLIFESGTNTGPPCWAKYRGRRAK